jgi:hypothetical protein
MGNIYSYLEVRQYLSICKLIRQNYHFVLILCRFLFLYGHGTCSYLKGTARYEVVWGQALGKFLFVPAIDEVTRGWRKPYNGEFHSSYSPPNVFRMTKSQENEMDGTCNMPGWVRNAYGILSGDPGR